MILPTKIINKILLYNIHPNAIIIKDFFNNFKNIFAILLIYEDRSKLQSIKLNYGTKIEKMVIRSFLVSINFQHYWMFKKNILLIT